jgi:hypothetical protein
MTTMDCGRVFMLQGWRSNTLSRGRSRTGNALGTGAFVDELPVFSPDKRCVPGLKRLNSCTLSADPPAQTPCLNSLPLKNSATGHWHPRNGCEVCLKSIAYSSYSRVVCCPSCRRYLLCCRPTEQTTNLAVQVPERNVSWMGVERRYIV